MIRRDLIAAAFALVAACDGAPSSGAGDLAPPTEDQSAADAPPASDLLLASCSDGVRDPQETDVDCGGPLCPACAPGLMCATGTDCASRICKNGVCAVPTCQDGVTNQDESDVDCGGSCPPCATGKSCNTGSDCALQLCVGGRCAAPSCSDGVKNGDESDVDCGGSKCAPCGVGLRCNVAADCGSKACAGGMCAAPTCSDNVKNGNESDVDCGGGCPKCAAGLGCLAATDCASGACAVTGKCAAATCSDGVKNGSESDVDCGGSCARCPDGKRCGAASDCASATCLSGTCSAPTCMDRVKNGSETDVDCGGGSCAPCVDGKACVLGARDCRSGVCMGGACQVSTCQDGVKNSSETDVDCGGGACPSCANGLHCSIGTDCASGLCAAGVCSPCATMDDCPAGDNCLANVCRPALSSCAAQEVAYPSSGDGEYVISPAGQPIHAYCDMALQIDLCDEIQGAKSGQTREGSALAYTMTAVLNHATGLCEMWAIRDAASNHPLDALAHVAGEILPTCAALGFLGDGAIDGSGFGSSDPATNAGYPIGTSYYRWGNHCLGCTMSDGLFAKYVLQGPVVLAGVLSNFSGTRRARCRIR